MWRAHSLSILGGISSGSVALLVLRLRRAARTSSGERANSDNLESVDDKEILIVGIVLSFPDTMEER